MKIRKIVGFVLAWLGLAAGVAGGAEFPYVAAVCEPEVALRSGPGLDFYATENCRNGDRLEVYKHTPDGWCAVRPPAGSFSYVAARYIQRAQGDLGRITGDNVPAYVGSRLVNDRSQVQVSLPVGRVVEVLEFPAPNALDAFCKISPPSGEFRWIHGSALSPNETGVTTVPQPPVRNVLAPDAPEPVGAPTVGYDTSPAPKNSFQWYLNQLDADLSYIMSGENPATWETEDLLLRANRLMNRAESIQQRERVESVRAKIIEADNIRRSRLQFQQLMASRENDNTFLPTIPESGSAGSPDPAKTSSRYPAPYSTTPGRWDYSGILVRVQRSRYADLLLPQYAIVNEDGLLRCYVTPPQNEDYSAYEKKSVVMAGTRNYLKEYRAFNLNVKIVVSVE